MDLLFQPFLPEISRFVVTKLAAIVPPPLASLADLLSVKDLVKFFKATLEYTLPHLVLLEDSANLHALSRIMGVDVLLLLTMDQGDYLVHIFIGLFTECELESLHSALKFLIKHLEGPTKLDVSYIVNIHAQDLLNELAFNLGSTTAPYDDRVVRAFLYVAQQIKQVPVTNHQIRGFLNEYLNAILFSLKGKIVVRPSIPVKQKALEV